MSSLVEQVQSNMLAESHSGLPPNSNAVWRADVFRLGGEEVMISAEVFHSSFMFMFHQTEDSERVSANTWVRWSENIRETFAEAFCSSYSDVLSEFDVLERSFIIETIYVTVVQNIVKQARESGLRVSRIYIEDQVFAKEFIDQIQ